MKSLLLSVTFLIIFLLALPAKIVAADLNISCDHAGCTPKDISSTFASEPWYPGKLMTRSIKITNNSIISKTFGVDAVNDVTTGEMDKMMNFAISQAISNLPVWSGTLSQFYNAGEIKLAEISARSSDEFNFTTTLPENTGNNYQNQSTTFDLIIGFIEDNNSPTPTSTPAPAATNTPTPAPSSDNSAAAAATPTPTPVQSNYISGYTVTSETPTPTGEILGQQNETAPIVTSGASCRNPWWGFLVVLFQGLTTVYLVKRVRRETLSQTVMVNIIATLTAILIFSLSFCFKWIIEIPLMLNLLTLYLIYRKLHPPLLNFSLIR